MPTNRDSVSVWYAAHSMLDHMRSKPMETQDHISDMHGGECGFMNDAIERAESFDAWSTDHVDFDAFGECWPYWLDCSFGKFAELASESGFSGDSGNLAVAILGGLPIKDVPPVQIEATRQMMELAGLEIPNPTT